MKSSNNPLGRRELRRFLQPLSAEQLVGQILELADAFPQVRGYYQAKVFPADDSTILKKYKAIITNEFFPRSGDGKARLSVARKAVADCKKVGSSLHSTADIMLHYVETGVAFTVEFGDINEPFYLSMERMYQAALKYLQENRLLGEFESRCSAIVHNTSGMGWGFHDTLGDMYEEYYG